MSSFFRNVFESLKKFAFGKTRNVVMLGLDAAGKTTILYRVQGFGSEILTTVPTIGFNVEEVNRSDLRFSCWDVGGCGKIRPLWRHYLQDLDALVFVIDSNDRERMEAFRIEFDLFLKENGTAHKPLMILANKQDLPSAMSVQETLSHLDVKSFGDRPWLIAPTKATAESFLDTGLDESFSWLWAQCAKKGPQSHPMSIPKGSIDSVSYLSTTDQCLRKTIQDPSNEQKVPIETSNQESKPLFDSSAVKDLEVLKLKQLESLRESILSIWESRCDDANEYNDDEFLCRLASYELDIWDHYTHIRIAWILITRHGIKVGYQLIESSLIDFIKNSGQTSGRSFHATMTRFWCHMIAYNIEAGVINNGRGDFSRFIKDIRRNPSNEIWQKSSFEHWYSRALMFSSAAKETVICPDLDLLPDIVGKIMKNEQLSLPLDPAYEEDIIFLNENQYWKKFI